MKTLKKFWNVMKRKGAIDMAKRQEGAATAAELQKMLEHCPICQHGFVGHSYALLATTILGGEENSCTNEFLDALKEHRWRDARQFQEWEGSRDNLVAYALRCTDGRLVLLIVHDFFELFYSSGLVECDCLSVENSRQLEAVFELEWRSF